MSDRQEVMSILQAVQDKAEGRVEEAGSSWANELQKAFNEIDRLKASRQWVPVDEAPKEQGDGR